MEMIMGVMLPLLANSWAQNNKEEFKSRYQLAFDAMMIISMPMFIGLFLLSHELIILVAGEKFFVSGYALQILSIATLGVFLGGIFGHLAVAINLQKKVMWIYITNAFITLTGYMIFIPKYGMYGAAWMTVFSEFYTGIMLVWFIKKKLMTKLNLNLFFKILLSSLVMGIFIIFTKKLPVLLVIVLSALFLVIDSNQSLEQR